MLELSGKELDTLEVIARDEDDNNAIDLSGSMHEDLQLFGSMSASPSFLAMPEASKALH